MWPFEVASWHDPTPWCPTMCLLHKAVGGTAWDDRRGRGERPLARWGGCWGPTQWLPPAPGFVPLPPEEPQKPRNKNETRAILHGSQKFRAMGRGKRSTTSRKNPLLRAGREPSPKSKSCPLATCRACHWQSEKSVKFWVFTDLPFPDPGLRLNWSC